MLSELSPRSCKQDTQSCLRSLPTHDSHWHQNVFPTWEAGGRKSKSGYLLFSPNCTRLPGVWRNFITLRSKKMVTKLSRGDKEELLQLSEAIFRREKWSCTDLLERSGLKMPRQFDKFEKPPFPISSKSTAVSMRSQRYVAADFRRRRCGLAWRTARWMDFGLASFFESKTALSTVKVSFLGWVCAL